MDVAVVGDGHTPGLRRDRSTFYVRDGTGDWRKIETQPRMAGLFFYLISSTTAFVGHVMSLGKYFSDFLFCWLCKLFIIASAVVHAGKKGGFPFSILFFMLIRLVDKLEI